ncbi:MAG: DUF6002 family protein, partial [Jatrophihabitantaceae bacterium]
MIIDNAIARYHTQIQHALNELNSGASAEEFTPGHQLPGLTSQFREFLSVSTMAYAPLAEYGGHQLSLLDLTRNPATGTTKTFASLVIVARAVNFIRATGQHVTIVTPSSANKAVALRDAVLRAIQCELVDAEQLNIVAIVPAGSAYKLRPSELSADPELRRRNPVAVYEGSDAAAVKAIAHDAVHDHNALFERTAKTNVWHTLKLENYLAADVVRAFVEQDFFAPQSERARLHAHSVSSAYGLLGHAYGRTLIEHSDRWPSVGYLLVQHLGAPDMVLHLYRGQPDGFDTPPRYTRDSNRELHRQGENPHFPKVTFDPEEILDPTFYTRNPATSERMTALIREQGGGGIVVSRAECLDRYEEVRSLLSNGGMTIPADADLVQEWSIIMALTGILNAIDRKIVHADEIVLHGSGIYSSADYSPIGSQDLFS